MSYNGSGTFQINTSGQPVVAGTVISSTAFNALTADLATGLSTAITKDGQTTTTARIPFAAGINSSLVTDSTNTTSGSIITAGGVGVAKALFVGTTANIAGVLSTTSPNITTSITTPSTSFDLINATATTLNLGGAATAVNVGAATGTMTVANTTFAAKAITASTTLSVTGVTTVQAGTAALPAITTSGDTNTGIFFPAADTIAFSEGGVEAARFDSAGNFGLGVTPSAWSTSTQFAFQVYTAGVSGNGGGNTASRFTHGCYLDGSTWKYQYTTVAPTRYEVTGANAGSTHSWSIAAGGTAGNAITFTQAMTLDASGNLLVNTTTAQTGAKLSVTGGISGTITSGTAVASTSGTSIDFTSLPSWVKRITVMFSGVSTNGSSNFLVQTGAGSIVNTGYAGQCATFAGSLNAMSTGFIVENNVVALNTHYGQVVLTYLGSNTWVEAGLVGNQGVSSNGSSSAGQIVLSGTLDRVRITTVNGTDTFDAGSINILYEG